MVNDANFRQAWVICRQSDHLFSAAWTNSERFFRVLLLIWLHRLLCNTVFLLVGCKIVDISERLESCCEGGSPEEGE